MRRITLQALTWGTVAAAVSSALWLAASESNWPEARKFSQARRTGMGLFSDRNVGAPSAGMIIRTSERGQAVQPR